MVIRSRPSSHARRFTRTFSRHDGYFNTFGGNPVSCAAALAVLDVIEDEQLQDNARVIGEQLRAGLAALAERHDAIGDVRANGLFIAVEFVSDRAARLPDAAVTNKVVNELRQRGILTGAIGADNNILKLRPPMVIQKAEADLMLATLDDVLQAVSD